MGDDGSRGTPLVDGHNCRESTAGFTGHRLPGVRRVLGTAAALGLLAVSATAAAPAAQADGAQGGGTTLPPIPRVLEGKACTKPSAKKASEPPWQQAVLNPALAWDLTEGDGATVAVVDTGVDATGSPALAGRVTAGPDVVAGGSAGTDCVGHGTFVAGLIAAAKPADVGFAGVAPGTHILAVRATEHDGTTSADHIAAGIEAAVKGGAKVVDVPVALASGSAALSAAVKAAQAKDVLVIAPAYGEQQESGKAAPFAYPAQLPGVVAVASLAPPDGLPDQQVPPATAPDLAAPGQNVLSIGPRGAGHFTGSGADLASGFVAGTAALVRSYRPDLTAPQVLSRLERTAYHYQGAGAGPLVGWGTVDPGSAVTANLSTSVHAGDTGAAEALRLPAPESGAAGHRAWIIAGASAVLLALMALAAAVIPRGQRRGWRPGRLAADGGGPSSGGPAGGTASGA
ncbi:S8 family serine peptidase [Streptomyces sp. NPDC048644]|uniref:S8 family serine peptidase n=1 Tax=Streptomyces sp. NPDC048644 TaxID=3365582 RepID=UPI00371A3336